jgi:hypothetical protein
MSKENVFKLASIILGVGCFVVAAVVLKGSGYEMAVAGAGGLLIGLPVTPQVMK